jgi:hypothetical protein
VELLFSLEELRELVEQIEQGNPQDDLIDESAQKRRRKKPGRVGKLPSHIVREIVRHELTETDLPHPTAFYVSA